MKLTTGAIRRYPMIFAFMALATILGFKSYLGLPRESSPDVKIPFVMVMAPYAGTSPEDMENLVTRKLEQRLKGVEDLKEMSSSSSYGMSVVTLEFDSRVVMSDALQSVRDRVELAKPDLPEDPRNDLVVQEISSADAFPVMQVNLYGDIDLRALKRAGEDLQEALEQIPGVLGVDLVGGIENEVQVDVDPEKLAYFDLGLVDVQDAIALQNLTIPGGKLGMGQYDYQVRVRGEIENVEELLGFVLNPGLAPAVHLRDVATVQLGVRDRETISRVDGRDAVTLVVKKRSGENLIDIARLVKATIAELQPAFPAGLSFNIVADQSVQIKRMVKELEDNIISGLILVVVVLLAFFGVRNSFLVAVAIPFSMLITFIVLSLLGITLNMVVLFSLILALGMLVDNSIVIVDNVYRHRGDGYDADTAAALGVDQVAAAVTSSTLTTVCAFGPLVFWPGIMGEFMKYLPITVIITLMASLLVALVFNPVLCARFLRPPRGAADKPRLGDRLLDFGMRTYQPVLDWSLRHPFRVLLGMNVLLVAMVGLFSVFNAGVELFPDTEPQFATVKIDAPSGTRIEVTDNLARQLEKEVAAVPDLKAYATSVGTPIDATSGGAGLPSHQGGITMEFVDHADRTQSSRRSIEELRARLAAVTGARITVDKMEEGPPTGKPVNIEISGDNFDELGRLAAGVKEKIRGVTGLVDIADNYDHAMPELRVLPDVDKAGRYGLRTTDIAGTVRTALNGTETAKYRVGEDEYDVIVRYQRPFRGKVEDLENATVFHEGKTVPLGAFARTEFGTGLAAVHRLGARRTVTVTAEVADGFNANALLAQVRQVLGGYPLPPGYHLDFTGESKDQEEASAFLEDAFMVAILLIFVVLVSQFASVTVPGVILGSVVLSLIGVLAGLMVTHTAFGIIMTGVGVISLAGVVVNNAIVLLDYIIKLRQGGMEKHAAIMLAGQTRFRPVVLTAVTTVLGLVPLTTGLAVDFSALLHGHFSRALVLGGESSQWWGPMGVAVIWGLTVATFLTLVVVPVMYATIEPIKAALARPFRGAGAR